MAISVIEVCNKALLLIGANIITSLDEGSVESTTINALWDTVRRSTLRLHPWNFALKDAELPLLVLGADLKYTHTFTLPPDCLRVIKVYNNYDYKLNANTIRTNREDCSIKYVFDNTNVTTWDASFVDVVAYKLATEIAYPITKSTSLMAAMNDLFGRHLVAAKTIDASEDIEDPYGQGDSPFIGVRF